jgi:hypothetical protein
MKTFYGLLLTISLVVSAAGQQSTRPTAEVSVFSDKIVKNAPFSAEAVSESVQTLADGNRIVNSSTGKLHRNSEGRFRREMGSGTGSGFTIGFGAGNHFFGGPAVTLLDPVAGFRYQLDLNLKTARQAALPPTIVFPNKAPAAAGGQKNNVPLADEATKAHMDALKLQMEGVKSQMDGVKGHMEAMKEHLKGVARVSGQAMTYEFSKNDGGTVFAPLTKQKYESRTDNLGTQNIEGVEAEGTRTTTTIPAGAIGNDRPIEIVYERWYSNNLQLVVMSKNTDPRFGEQTYRLTNIIRSEPDPSLFSLPTDYRLITDPGLPYRINTAAKTAAGTTTIYKVRATDAAAKPAPAAAKFEKTKP